MSNVHHHSYYGGSVLNSDYIPPPSDRMSLSIDRKIVTTKSMPMTIHTSTLAASTQRLSSQKSNPVTLVSSFSISTTVVTTPTLTPTTVVVATNDTSLYSTNTHHAKATWFPPLLGILVALMIAALAFIIFYYQRRRRSRLNGSTQKSTKDNYKSWTSFSTLNNTETHFSQPPPAYSSTREKRFTADTLVAEPTWELLKKQYSPQLAMSPSLIESDVYQSHAFISPSDTLIDHADSKLPRKIELYDPQVNLVSSDYEDEELKYNNTEYPKERALHNTEQDVV